MYIVLLRNVVMRQVASMMYCISLYPQQYQYATEGAGRRGGSQTAEGRGREQIFAGRIRLPSHIRVLLCPLTRQKAPAHPATRVVRHQPCTVYPSSILDLLLGREGGREF